jgi:hypothetical protein
VALENKKVGHRWFKLMSSKLLGRVLDSAPSQFLRVAVGFYVLIFQPPVNFCPYENIQLSFVVVGYDNVLKQIQFNNQKEGIR